MRWIALLLVALLAGGCVQARYLVQAAGGQWEIARRSQPISQVLRQRRAPLHVRRVLARVPQIKAFAELSGLRPSRNYDAYADLERSAAVWVVQACAPLEFTPREWHFPLVGSVPYLGFFDEGRAHAFARRLAEDEPLDVDVRTASAYSTLGWLRDPVLSTMISDAPEAMGELANVILHESVHATVYIPGQSAFDESLASFVGDRLTLAWLELIFGEDAPPTLAWRRWQAGYEAQVDRMHAAWVELDALYRSDLDEAHKRAEKARILEALTAALGATRPLNNATLAGLKHYRTGHAGFERLFEACGRKWPRFLEAVGSLSPADFPAPQLEDFEPVLDALAARRCRD